MCSTKPPLLLSTRPYGHSPQQALVNEENLRVPLGARCTPPQPPPHNLRTPLTSKKQHGDSPRRAWGTRWTDRSGCVPLWARCGRRFSPSPPAAGTYPSPPASRCPAGSGSQIFLQGQKVFPWLQGAVLRLQRWVKGGGRHQLLLSDKQQILGIFDADKWQICIFSKARLLNLGCSSLRSVPQFIPFCWKNVYLLYYFLTLTPGKAINCLWPSAPKFSRQ